MAGAATRAPSGYAAGLERLSRKRGGATAGSSNAHWRNLGTSCLKRSIVQLPPIREWTASRPDAQAVVGGLQIEAAVEIERRAILVELGADPRRGWQGRSRPARARQQRPLDRAGGNALRALVLDPFDLGKQRARLHRNAQDDLVLDDQAGDRLADDARLRAEQAEQQRQQLQIVPESPAARPHGARLRSKALNVQ